LIGDYGRWRGSVSRFALEAVNVGVQPFGLVVESIGAFMGFFKFGFQAFDHVRKMIECLTRVRRGCLGRLLTRHDCSYPNLRCGKSMWSSQLLASELA
jgi:hypothetical protein